MEALGHKREGKNDLAIAAMRKFKNYENEVNKYQEALSLLRDSQH